MCLLPPGGNIRQQILNIWIMEGKRKQGQQNHNLFDTKERRQSKRKRAAAMFGHICCMI